MLVTFLVSLVVCLIVFIIIILNPSLSSDIIAIVNNLSLPDIVLTSSTGPKKGPKIDTREDTNTASDAADASDRSTATGVTLADSNSNFNDPPSTMSDKELNAILLSHIYTLTPLNATMHGKIKRQDVTRRDKT